MVIRENNLGERDALELISNPLTTHVPFIQVQVDGTFSIEGQGIDGLGDGDGLSGSQMLSSSFVKQAVDPMTGKVREKLKVARRLLYPDSEKSAPADRTIKIPTAASLHTTY